MISNQVLLEPLPMARRLGAQGKFDQFRSVCSRIARESVGDAAVLQELGGLYGAYGFLTEARDCYEQAGALLPSTIGHLANIANLARDAGEHTRAREIYTGLLEQLPDHPVVRRNFLTGLEYDPHARDFERLRHAEAWGQWATSRAGGPYLRPVVRPLHGRPLRIGYVSADFCQHTVGLFIKDVLKAHDPECTRVFTYNAGLVNDWVTKEIRSASGLVDISVLTDVEVADRIRQDGIDVLVDLSGHTGGSRLSAFVYRPAPIQISWLGYFATTGLDCIDAVLLDQQHAPEGAEALFVEPIVHLPAGRFCYRPVPWAPNCVAPPPSERRGYVTFGSFNNTAKLNAGVLDVWARLLTAVPRSRLVLKWRTFNDAAFRDKLTLAFVNRGIDPSRIELRGPSFHAELLEEYADIDIALDPFPFTGGLTSCEALWMGVPVVTWPQGRVVSRQTLSFLHQIGLGELAADSADDYVRIASELAHSSDRIGRLRSNLRGKMRESPMMDVADFTRQLEDTMIRLYHRIVANVST